MDPCKCIGIVVRVKRGGDPMADFFEFVDPHPTGRKRWAADPNAAWIHRLTGIERDHVHVDRDTAMLEGFFGDFAPDTKDGHVDEH